MKLNENLSYNDYATIITKLESCYLFVLVRFFIELNFKIILVIVKFCTEFRVMVIT